MPIDRSQAQASLDRLGSLLSYSVDKQYAAAKALLREIAQLKKPPGVVGMAFNESPEMLEVNTSIGYCRVWFGGPKAAFQVAQRDQENTTQALGAHVEFDKVADEFVAADYDDAIAPSPGQPRPKRDAAALIIEAIAQYLVARAR